MKTIKVIAKIYTRASGWKMLKITFSNTIHEMFTFEKSFKNETPESEMQDFAKAKVSEIYTAFSYDENGQITFI